MGDRSNSSAGWSLEQDVEFIVSSTAEIWPSMRGARIFITGGTGFIGSWLLESLRLADQRLDLGMHATVLSRNPEAFQQKLPHLANYPNFHFISGDICSFDSPTGSFTHLIHGATYASAALNESNPRRMFDTIVQGTRRVLDFTVEKSVQRMLFLSSGAVYGQQPWELERISEEWLGSPDCTDPKAAYAEGKRAAEMLCAIYNKQYGVNVSIARIFALLGPRLDLNTHFAAGNFIRDAIHDRQVIVRGNGSPCRSYLYATDLTIWLWHLLIRSKPLRPYNVGSNESISICNLAERTAGLLADGDFQVLGERDEGWNTGRYVPETIRIGSELGLFKTVSLDDAILRTAMWNGWNGN
jgi:nucleoside-diphosphate-sugar epimerase